MILLCNVVQNAIAMMLLMVLQLVMVALTVLLIPQYSYKYADTAEKDVDVTPMDANIDKNPMTAITHA